MYSRREHFRWPSDVRYIYIYRKYFKILIIVVRIRDTCYSYENNFENLFVWIFELLVCANISLLRSHSLTHTLSLFDFFVDAKMMAAQVCFLLDIVARTRCIVDKYRTYEKNCDLSVNIDGTYCQYRQYLLTSRNDIETLEILTILLMRSESTLKGQPLITKQRKRTSVFARAKQMIVISFSYLHYSGR